GYVYPVLCGFFGSEGYAYLMLCDDINCLHLCIRSMYVLLLLIRSECEPSEVKEVKMRG
nr:hypothetical protein [Tanacetum cinerariifolium]